MTFKQEWRWCTCADIYTKKCESQCGERLHDSVIEFKEAHWHVHCLINHLLTQQEKSMNPYDRWLQGDTLRLSALTDDFIDCSDQLNLGRKRFPSIQAWANSFKKP